MERMASLASKLRASSPRANHAVPSGISIATKPSKLSSPRQPQQKKVMTIVTDDVHMEEYIDAIAQLLDAIERNRLTTVKYLLEQRLCSANDTDAEGWTPLMVAADQGHVHIVQYLIEAGGIVDMWNLEGKSAVMIACERGHVEVVQCLVEHRADILTQNKKTGWTSLMIATFFGRVSVVQYLLSKIGYSAAVNVQRTEDGWTALMMAAFFGYLHVAKLLLDHGGSLESLNYQGSTPLMLATLRNHEHIVRLFLQYGANVNVQNIYGLNVLMIAAERGYFPLVQFFVEQARINLQAQDQNGYTALMIASTSHQVPTEIVHYLVKQGSQLFMQEAGDEASNHQPDRLPKFSSYITPLMAGLLKTFVYSSAIDIAPKFVYRYVVISAEGYLLYFDTSSDPQDHVQLDQHVHGKLPLFHSHNIHGKINLNDLSYTVAIKSANQEDLEAVANNSFNNNTDNNGNTSTGNTTPKVLRRLYSKDEMITSYLHTSPSSSPKGKARHLLASIAEDSTTALAGPLPPTTSPMHATPKGKASKPQLDFPIEFSIPTMSFTWTFYTENVIEQIRWYSAFMKFLRYEPSSESVVGKTKKPPLLPIQVNTHPSVRRVESASMQLSSPLPLSPLPQAQPFSFPVVAPINTAPPSNSNINSVPESKAALSIQVNYLQSPTSRSAKSQAVAAPANSGVTTSSVSASSSYKNNQQTTSPAIQLPFSPSQPACVIAPSTEKSKTPKSAASMYKKTSFHYRVQTEGAPVNIDPVSPKMTFKPLKQIIDEKKIITVSSPKPIQVAKVDVEKVEAAEEEEYVTTSHKPFSAPTSAKKEQQQASVLFDDYLDIPSQQIPAPKADVPKSPKKDYVIGQDSLDDGLDDDASLQETAVIIPKKSRKKSIKQSMMKGLYYLSSSFSLGSKSKDSTSNSHSLADLSLSADEADEALPTKLPPNAAPATAMKPSPGKDIEDEDEDELDLDGIDILEQYMQNEEVEQKQQRQPPATAKKQPQPRVEDVEDDSTIGDIQSVQSLHVDELQDDLTPRQRARSRSDATKVSQKDTKMKDSKKDTTAAAAGRKGGQGVDSSEVRDSFPSPADISSTNFPSSSSPAPSRSTTTPPANSLAAATAARRNLLLASKKSFKRLNSFKHKAATNNTSSKIRRLPSRRLYSPNKPKAGNSKKMDHLDMDLIESMDNPMSPKRTSASQSPNAPRNRRVRPTPVDTTSPRRRTIGNKKPDDHTHVFQDKPSTPVVVQPVGAESHCQCAIS